MRAPPGSTTEVRLVRARRALWRAGEFGVVVLPPQADSPVTLAGTGALLWDALATPRTEADLAVDLAAPFAADPVVVATDLRTTLELLLELGALEEQP